MADPEQTKWFERVSGGGSTWVRALGGGWLGLVLQDRSGQWMWQAWIVAGTNVGWEDDSALFDTPNSAMDACDSMSAGVEVSE